ncbi:AfsA-related hotdog domain-containing protein [Humibacter albus]|uniref:AfsA-related hotdog domain-containing protein n=1 Tax=Humibacter albus TaxID=427754 RepID=UPI0003B5C84A|nr:AfsA-related hotdog domain-containing protein [Humibacter albus]
MALIDGSAAHRSTRSESLVWAIEPASHDGEGQTWFADVEIPRSHWLCHPVPDVIPVTLLAEAFRQAGLAICVAGLGMGQSVHFIVSRMTVVRESDPLHFPRFGAFVGRLEVTFAEIGYRKGAPHVLSVDYVLPGVASGHVDARILTDRDYRVLRRNAVPLDDEIRTSLTELVEVVERDGDRLVARLGVNESDPFFFDHAVDHLPGMLLLHAVARIHEDEHGTPPRFLTIEFPAFGEFRVATTVEADFSGTGAEVAFTQGDRTVATAVTDTRDISG